MKIMNSRRSWFLLLMVCAAFMFMACATTPFPACNDKYPPGARLTQIANAKGVCLQDVGTTLILANGVNISVAKLYTASQALAAVDEWAYALERPISDIFFRKLVNDRIGAFPELIMITEAFDTDFGTGKILDADSRAILRKYLIERVRPMLLARAQSVSLMKYDFREEAMLASAKWPGP